MVAVRSKVFEPGAAGSMTMSAAIRSAGQAVTTGVDAQPPGVTAEHASAIIPS